MRAAVIIFPGSNCDRDLVVAMRKNGIQVSTIWHKEQDIPKNLDLIAIPGGFSFGDYLLLLKLLLCLLLFLTLKVYKLRS